MTRIGSRRFGLLGFALLCLGGCKSPSTTETSTGGETSDVHVEIGRVEPAPETEGSDDSETTSAPEVPPHEVPPHEVPPHEVPPHAPTSAPEQAAASPRPTTILAPARSGRLRLSDVHDVIREHRPAITACYELGLVRDTSLFGEAKVRFLIGPRGRIDDAEVYESTLGDQEVEACIIAAMREWRFPRPRPRGSSVLLTYPFILSTE